MMDELLSAYDVRERHAIDVKAPAQDVYPHVRALDLTGSRRIGLLFRMRGLPRSALRIEGLVELGFSILAENVGEELVLGLIGQFWTRRGGVLPVPAGQFEKFATPGYAKAVWGFRVSDAGDGRARLSTETRVRCTDAASRRAFRVYWFFIRPLSGWIRMEILRSIRTRAERGLSG